MRMRRKKHLEERLDAVKSLIVVRKPAKIYAREEKDRFDLIDLRAVFGNDRPVLAEIGCGKGGFLLEAASRNPDINYIGIEVAPNVAVVAAEKIAAAGLTNVKFMLMGAQLIHYVIPAGSIGGIYLNFSCPFPKNQYANNRLTYWRFLEKYKIVLNSNGWIKLKTDNRAFFDYSVNSLEENGFSVVNGTYDLYATDAADNIQTEYEKKFLKRDMKICYLEASVKGK